jgi:cytochrome b
MNKIRVWDLPIRLFHWSLAVLVTVAIVTQKIGGDALEWHFRAGYAILALVCFRIVWGVIGSHYARFASFLYSPATIIAYVRGGPKGTQHAFHGHTPIGSLSVLALLLIVLAQTVSGLFSNDDIASEGPLVHFISKGGSDSVTWFHAQVGGNLVYILVGLHVAAIAYYFIRRKINLVTPMVTGDKPGASGALAADDSMSVRLLAASVLAVCAGAVYFLVHL